MERSPSQHEKALRFGALHEREGPFVVPNPWDVGTARLLAALGFEALATSSAAYAKSIGKRDHEVARDEMLAHVAAIAAATPLPVAADLGNGFGDSPQTVAETIRLAAATGIAGASIEDADGATVYPIAYAVERVRAAVESARALPFPFVLTARAENFLCGNQDLDDTVERLRAYQDAGADVLYAPGLVDERAIAAVVAALKRPLNVLCGLPGFAIDVRTLGAIGVKRISVGSAFFGIAQKAVERAAIDIRDRGTLDFPR